MPDAAGISRLLAVLVVGVATGRLVADPPLCFEEVGGARGLGPYAMEFGMGGGVAAADFDDDGDVDLFVPNRLGVPDQVYRNDGTGHYEEVAAELGLASTASARAGLWLDVDGDRRLDLLVVGDGCNTACPRSPMLQLYRQTSAGDFVNVTEQAGLSGLVELFDGMHLGGLCAGDVTGDERPDVLVAYWEGQVLLLVNATGPDGAVAFADEAVAGGVAGHRPHWQPVMHDLDGDGWLDIYQAVDFIGNILWLNQGDGTFTDAAPALGVDNSFNDMGVTLGDCDDDGDLDVYVTNAAQNGMYSVLYRNDSVGAALSFTERAQAAGVDDGGWGWGATFLDADRDGRLDLAATNGAWGPWADDRSRLWLNQGGDPLTFVDIAAEAGFDDAYWGSGLVAFDHERDGDLDVVQTCAAGGPLRLLENEPGPAATTRHWLIVRPRQSGPNWRGLGALVAVEAGGRTMTRLISAGTSFLSQEPAEAFFGLDTHAVVDRIVVTWPDGGRTELEDVPADRLLEVTRAACDADLDGNGTVDVDDLLEVVLAWGRPGPADLDGDGAVDADDLVAVLLAWGPCV